MIKDKVYIKCRILKGTRGRNYDLGEKYLNNEWKMTKKKYLTDYWNAMSLVEFHFPDLIFDDKKIEVEYDIVNNRTNKVLYNCIW